MPGAADLEDAWIRARLGEDGYMAGKDAEAAACDAQTVPVVTGTVDPGHRQDDRPGRPPKPADGADRRQSPREQRLRIPAMANP